MPRISFIFDAVKTASIYVSSTQTNVSGPVTLLALTNKYPLFLNLNCAVALKEYVLLVQRGDHAL